MNKKDELEFCKEVITWLGISRDALETQLAEAEEPKLRHGAYGISADGKGFIIIEQSTLIGSPKAFFGDMSGLMEADQRMLGYLRVGDFFKELEALSEPLTEFELDATFISGCLERSGTISLVDRGEKSSLPYAKVRELIVYLRRLLHTARTGKE